MPQFNNHNDLKVVTPPPSNLLIVQEIRPRIQIVVMVSIINRVNMLIQSNPFPILTSTDLFKDSYILT